MNRNFFVKNIFIIISLFTAFELFAGNCDISLMEKAQASGMAVYWDTMTSSGILEKNGHQISFQADNEMLILDSAAIALSDAPKISGGKVLVSQDFLDTAEDYFKSSAEGNGFKIGAILIDPGHGGKDPGASGTFKVNGKTIKVTEKDVVLTIGKSLYSKLKQAYPDHRQESHQ